MDRLSPLDAAFPERGRGLERLAAIASVALAEGPAPTREEFTAAFAALLL